MTAYDILGNIKSDIEIYVNQANGYLNDIVAVYQGYVQWDEIKQYPAISITMTSDAPFIDQWGEETKGYRKMTVLIYGYSRRDGTTKPIHDLKEDMLNFLHSESHNSNIDDIIEQVGMIEVYEGSLNDPALIFQMELNLIFKQE